MAVLQCPPIRTLNHHLAPCRAGWGSRFGSRHEELLTLSVEVEVRGNEAVVRLEGELDIATADAASDRVLPALEEAGRLVVDLRGLSFVDSSGLQLCIDWLELAERRGRSMEFLVGEEGPPAVFRLAGLDQVLPLLYASDGECEP